MTRENRISMRQQPAQEMPLVPQWGFFQTTAGPGETAYPDSGDSPTVYYAQKLKNVGYTETPGAQSLSTTATGKYAYLFNLSTEDYIEEDSIVLCWKLNGQWYTIDKVRCQQVYAVCHDQGDVTYLTPADGSEIDTLTPTASGLAGFGPSFVADCRVYVGGGSGSRVLKLDDEEGTIAVSVAVGIIGDLRQSQYASGREMLLTDGTAARRYSYDLDRDTTLEADYDPPVSAGSTQWAAGIDEFSASGNGIICGWGKTSAGYCAGYDRDPSSGIYVTPNWYYPTGAGAPQRARCLRRIVDGATDTFVVGLTVPNGASQASWKGYFSLEIFTANRTSFGTVSSQIKLHSSPWSDNENEAATTADEFTTPLDVLPVPDGDGDFYVVSSPALDSGVGYSWWRINSSGTLVWRHAETDLSPYLSGNAAVDPGTGDLISAWTDISNTADTAADYGVLRLKASDGSLVWKVTLGTTNLASLSPNRIQGIAAGQVQ